MCIVIAELDRLQFPARGVAWQRLFFRISLGSAYIVVTSLRIHQRWFYGFVWLSSLSIGSGPLSSAGATQRTGAGWSRKMLAGVARNWAWRIEQNVYLRDGFLMAS